jgi:hypothetical protein
LRSLPGTFIVDVNGVVRAPGQHSYRVVSIEFDPQPLLKNTPATCIRRRRFITSFH